MELCGLALLLEKVIEKNKFNPIEFQIWLTACAYAIKVRIK